MSQEEVEQLHSGPIRGILDKTKQQNTQIGARNYLDSIQTTETV